MIGHYKISPSASKAISYENNVTNNTSSLEKKKKKKGFLKAKGWTLEPNCVWLTN